MRSRRYLLLVVFAFALGLSIVPLVLAPAVAGDDMETQFTKGLGQARDLLGKGDCKEGLTLVKQLLARHARHPHALARRAEILDLVERLAFGIRHPWPKPRDLVSGKLIRYAPSTGAIKIEYTPRTARDLETVGSGVLAFPARMKGSFSVKLEGRPLPPSISSSPRLIVGSEPDPKTGRMQTWILVAGSPKRREGRQERWLPARLIHIDGEKEEVAAERNPSPVKAGCAYELELKVRAKKITAKVMGGSIGSDKKSPDVFGRVAFSASSWKELTIDGIVEPSWIQGRIDEAVHGKLERFRAQYDRSAHIPKWLLDAGAGQGTAATRGSGASEAKWPEGTDEEHIPALEEAAALIAKGQASDAIDTLQVMKAESHAAAACDYLAAQAHVVRFQMPKALNAVDACIEQASSFLPARFLKASILGRMGRSEEALAVLDATLESHPKDPAVYEKSAVLLLFAGLPDEASDVAYRALKQRLNTPALEALSAVLVNAVSGPAWTRRFEYESDHYHVYSDIDETTCRKAAQTLEEGYRAFEEAFQRPGGDSARRFKVYLFRGQRGFRQYMEDLGDLGGPVHVNVAGLYSTLLKQLLIWNLPNREMMLRTVRHEGLHQYLDEFLPAIPSWFNEGLAEYFEHSHRTGAKICFGRVRHDYVKLLRSRPTMPVSLFLYLPPRQFYAGGIPNYAKAWALVHMFKHGGAAQQAMFQQLLKDLETHSPWEALARAFADLDVDALDKELDAYLDELAEDGS